MTLPFSKAHVTCQTNVAVLNLFTRSVQAGLEGVVLVMRREVVPREIRQDICEENVNWIDTTFEEGNPKKLPAYPRLIVFSTMSSSHSSLFKNFDYDTVFLDEAAQVPLFRGVTILRQNVRRVVLAGDPCQLPGLVSPEGLAARLEVSMMEHLVNCGFQTTFLPTQRRGHPDIFSFSSLYVYDGKLKSDYAPVPPSSRSPNPVIVYDTKGAEKKIGTSFFNQREAVRVEICYRVMKKTWLDCVVIVGYKAQFEELKNRGVQVYTVDSFQGKEADCVIVSTVRNNNEGKVGFWNDKRRLNVALTRAKHQLVLVGSCETWKKSTGIMRRLHNHLEHLIDTSPVNDAEQQMMDVFIDQLDLGGLQSMVQSRPWGQIHTSASALDTVRRDEAARAWYLRTILFRLTTGVAKLKEGTGALDPQLLHGGGSDFVCIWSVDIDCLLNKQAIWVHAVLKKGDTGARLVVEKRIRDKATNIRKLNWSLDQRAVLEAMLPSPASLQLPDTDSGGDGSSDAAETTARNLIATNKFLFYRNGVENLLLPEDVALQCDLNEEQSRLALVPGPVIIQGRSGCGKTEVIIGRVLSIVLEGQYQECRPSILVVARLPALLKRIREKIEAVVEQSCLKCIRFETSPVSSGEKFDYVFVDEVQDWPHSQLQKIVHSCIDARGLMMVGDTAQTVNADNCSFNFDRIKDAIFDANSQLRPQVLNLSVNYRSHHRVVKFANSITSFLHKFFPDSIDFLGEESALRDGPPVVRFVQPWSSDVFVLNANQVCIIESDDWKDRIQRTCSGLVLLPSEVKGLEFDDVVCVGFLSKGKKKRLHRLNHEHEILISKTEELLPWAKALYVSVTRSKGRVGFYDEDPQSTFFEPEVKSESVTEFTGRSSTPQEWQNKGEEYEAIERWAAAVQCFDLANNPNRATFSKAKHYFADARFVEAAKLLTSIKVDLLAADALAFNGLKELAMKCYVEMEQFDKVIELYKEGERMIPKDRMWEIFGSVQKRSDIKGTALLLQFEQCGLECDEKLAWNYYRMSKWTSAAGRFKKLLDFGKVAECSDNAEDYVTAYKNWLVVKDNGKAILSRLKMHVKEGAATDFDFLFQCKEDGKLGCDALYAHGGIVSEIAIHFEKYDKLGEALKWHRRVIDCAYNAKDSFRGDGFDVSESRWGVVRCEMVTLQTSENKDPPKKLAALVPNFTDWLQTAEQLAKWSTSGIGGDKYENKNHFDGTWRLNRKKLLAEKSAVAYQWYLAASLVDGGKLGECTASAVKMFRVAGLHARAAEAAERGASKEVSDPRRAQTLRMLAVESYEEADLALRAGRLRESMTVFDNVEKNTVEKKYAHSLELYRKHLKLGGGAAKIAEAQEGVIRCLYHLGGKGALKKEADSILSKNKWDLKREGLQFEKFCAFDAGDAYLYCGKTDKALNSYANSAKAYLQLSGPAVFVQGCNRQSVRLLGDGVKLVERHFESQHFERLIKERKDKIGHQGGGALEDTDEKKWREGVEEEAKWAAKKDISKLPEYDKCLRLHKAIDSASKDFESGESIGKKSLQTVQSERAEEFLPTCERSAKLMKAAYLHFERAKSAYQNLAANGMFNIVAEKSLECRQQLALLESGFQQISDGYLFDYDKVEGLKGALTCFESALACYQELGAFHIAFALEGWIADTKEKILCMELAIPK